MRFQDTFSELEDSERETFLGLGTPRSFTAGDVILEQNVEHRGFWVITKGEAGVEQRLRVVGRYKSKDKAPIEKTVRIEVDRMGPGEMFGEMSFIDGAPTSARVVAKGDIDLLYIEGDAIQELVEKDLGFKGRFFHSMAKILASRLRAANKDRAARRLSNQGR